MFYEFKSESDNEFKIKLKASGFFVAGVLHAFVSHETVADASSQAKPPTSPNSHFRFPACIFYTQMLCHGSGMRRSHNMGKGIYRNCDAVSCFSPGNPCFQCCGLRKENASEAAENGGGEGKPGKP